jgi:RNA polymerase sigma-70 factor, ECF subfamily
MNATPLAPAVPLSRTGSPSERLADLFDAHYDRLHRLARRLTPTADDALDLVQETFLRTARAVDAVPAGARDEEAWLVRVLVNLRRDQWRRERTRRRAADLAPPPRPHAASAERQVEARDAIWRALDDLSPRRRAIVVMHELEDLSVASIAALLGVARVTVRWHLAVGRRELTRALARLESHRCGR